MKPKNTICLWFGKYADEAARFYAATFPDSKVTAVHEAPGDYPVAKGRRADGGFCLGLNGGPAFKHTEAFSFQIATENQEETGTVTGTRSVGNGGTEAQCGGACKGPLGPLLADHPRALTHALAAGGGEAKRAFQAMMTMNSLTSPPSRTAPTRLT